MIIIFIFFILCGIGFLFVDYLLMLNINSLRVELIIKLL